MNKEFYERWKNFEISDEIIDKELFDANWYSTVMNIISALQLKNRNNFKILEIGSGWGRILIGLRMYLPDDVILYGFELSNKLVKKTETLIAKYKLKNIKVFNVDVIKEEFPSELKDIEVIYSIRVFQYFSENERLNVLKKAYNLLKPNGYIFISIPNRFNPHRIMFYNHAPLLSIASLKKDIKNSGFKIRKIGGYNFLPPRSPFNHFSIFSKINYYLSRIPFLNLFGGLIYVVAQKN